MSGNIPVVTTTYEAGLQAKINAVNSATPIEDIISLVRAGELIDTIDNTPIKNELQIRMDAVDSGTDSVEYLELAAAMGKISNTIPSLINNAGKSEIPVLQTIVKVKRSSYIHTNSPLKIVPPDSDSYIRLTLLTAYNAEVVALNLKSGSRTIFSGLPISNRLSSYSTGTNTPSYYTIGSGSRVGYSYTQDLSAILEPIMGGKGETIEIGPSGQSSSGRRVFYAYEVWK